MDGIFFLLILLLFVVYLDENTIKFRLVKFPILIDLFNEQFNE